MQTLRLTAEQVETAAEILRRGGLLGIPTETVYGLGANGLDGEAVGRIFAAKGRPQDNPLILHIPSADWLERYCEDIPPSAYALAERFWPGPLTMILRHKPIVPDAVTAGLDTVGMRCPAHPVCRAIIAAAGVPVAAPSGNTSGRPSPTNMADMLEDMDGKIDGIVDGGPCAVGVESTIIDLTCVPPRLLRPGGITLEQLREVLGEERARTFHSHFSKIQFTPNGGEKMHLTFDQEDFGPDPAPLMAEVARRGWSPTFICESAGTQAEDALTMKKLYQAAAPGGEAHP